MNIQLVTTGTRDWIREDGTPVWGLGIEVMDVSGWEYNDDDTYTTHRHGWRINVMLGPWALNIYTRDAHQGWWGDYGVRLPFFERIRP